MCQISNAIFLLFIYSLLLLIFSSFIFILSLAITNVDCGAHEMDNLFKNALTLDF